MKKTALITGATSGIGEATAVLLASEGCDVILTGRRKQLLEKLEERIRRESGSEVCSLCFDIRDSGAVKAAIGSLEPEWRDIDILVNNAGLAAGLNTIDQGLESDWEQMIDTNIKGLLYITREVSPLMVARKKGHILNISSIAGKESYEKGNVYCATKHAVDSLSRSMRIDLLPHNIKVTNIAPGMAETEFSLVRFKGDRARAAKVYEGLKPLTALDIAETILFAITRPEHVCINDLLIMPTAQAAATIIKRGD